MTAAKLGAHLVAGHQLRTDREQAGLTRAQMAGLLHISVSHLRSLENGWRAITPDVRDRVGQVLAGQPAQPTEGGTMSAAEMKRLDLLDTDEAAQLLSEVFGRPVPKRRVQNYVRDGKIRAYRTDGRGTIGIPRQVLMDFVESCAA